MPRATIEVAVDLIDGCLGDLGLRIADRWDPHVRALTATAA